MFITSSRKPRPVSASCAGEWDGHRLLWEQSVNGRIYLDYNATAPLARRCCQRDVCVLWATEIPPGVDARNATMQTADAVRKSRRCTDGAADDPQHRAGLCQIKSAGAGSIPRPARSNIRQCSGSANSWTGLARPRLSVDCLRTCRRRTFAVVMRPDAISVMHNNEAGQSSRGYRR